MLQIWAASPLIELWDIKRSGKYVKKQVLFMASDLGRAKISELKNKSRNCQSFLYFNINIKFISISSRHFYISTWPEC